MSDWTTINREVLTLLEELKAMSINCKIEGENRAVYLGANKPRAREIGERLNEISGFGLMNWVALQVPAHDRRELDYAWDGIGDWLC